MHYKACFKCKESLPLEGFYKHKKMADGHLNKCIKCTKIDARSNQEKVGDTYDRSLKGLIRVIYKTQKRHQRARGHGGMPYDKDQLKKWLIENGILAMYESWVKSGFRKDEKPSTDRIDDFFGYSFDNMRLVTWKENREHQHEDIREGKGTSGRRCKKLLKMNSDLDVLDTYVSYSSAVRDMGYHLEYQIKNSKPCRSGFYWKYSEH